MKAAQLQNKAALLCNNKLVKTDKPRKVTPSVYTREILQSTEERLGSSTQVHPPHILEWLDMSRTSHHKLSLVDMDQPLFQPYPSELVFQNFQPGQTYTLPLLLLNNDKVSRQVKLEHLDSEYFHVVGPEQAGSKVAPGMSATFTVCFSPQENKDYHHRLVCATERERFQIPIRATGPRAILDFRDDVELPVCPAKASTQRTHLVRNVGNSRANFRLRTKRPFSVTPSSGTLDVGESTQVTVAFHPLTAGHHREDLMLHYHTGEDVYIGLHGSCEELDVRLDPDSVLLKKTYVSLSSVHTVSLANDSDVPLRYRWTDDPSSLRESSALLHDEEEENQQPQLQYGGSDRPDRPDRSARPAGDRPLDFSHHGCIAVEPAEGEIWPGTTAQFSIVFKPDQASLYQQTLYCDVTGRESPLPLTVRGEGLGPQLHLNYTMMDMKNVFIGDEDHFEVQVSNRGLIDAPFRLSGPDTAFGRCFSFRPREGVVPSGAGQIVEVTFRSRVLGSFSEDLLLAVTGQPQPLVLTFSGCVIGPTFHFNVSELNFGDVAFGFPLSLMCTLSNTSYVPMTFVLRVLGDGTGPPSVSSAQQALDASRKDWRGHAAGDVRAPPAEFSVSPESGLLRAMSDSNIKVTLCSNTVRRYRLALAVDVEGVGEEIMTLPINARSVVPELLVETPALDFHKCFLNHPYEQRVRLTNSSDVAACYGLLDQDEEESPGLVLSSSLPRGVILPGSSEELTVLLLAKAVGRQRGVLRIAVFGSAQPPLEVEASCVGQGPVLHVHGPQLHFGRIPVLRDVSKSLQLFNQSPIPAHFTTRMSQARSLWRVEPGEGEVPPGSQLELKVVAHLKDTLSFQDRLELCVRDGQTQAVPLTATGTGTTVVSDRPLGPSLDLGTHFSHGSCQYRFKLTNQGQRVQRLYWKIDGSVPSAKTRNFLPPISTRKPRDVPNRGPSPSSGGDGPVFSLSPSRAELFPGCSVDLLLTGSSHCSKVVRERLVCHAIVGRQASHESIISLEVTCRFVAPVLSISPKQLSFYSKKVRGKDLPVLYEKLLLQNVSCLSLSVELTLPQPFRLCDSPGERSSATAKVPAPKDTAPLLISNPAWHRAYCPLVAYKHKHTNKYINEKHTQRAQTSAKWRQTDENITSLAESVVLGDKGQAEVWVCFDPAFYQDRVSRIVDEVLEVRHRGHPQEDAVPLHAELHHPNLHLSSTAVDFGCVVNRTETREVITLSNRSLLPASYRWTFRDDRTRSERMEEEETRNPEWRGSSGALSPAFSFPRSPGPDDEQRVEETFDILPMFGLLQPGEQQQTTFSFYAHENVSRAAVAECRVDEGPAYRVRLRGEAAAISYSLQATRLDFGLQLFQQVGEVEVTLRNTGRVAFKYRTLYPQREEEDEAVEEAGGPMGGLEDGQQLSGCEDSESGEDVRPGRPLVVPSEGHIQGGAEQRLRVLYLPGVPEAFQKTLRLQAAFLPPQEVTLTGVGVFPRISLDLPRDLSEERCRDALELARTAVEADDGRAAPPTCSLTYEDLLHMEMERLLVRGNARAVTGSLLGPGDSQESSSRKWHKLSKFLLPEYVLDFGYVIPTSAVTHTVKVTNNGSIPVSFHASCKHLAGTGFTAEFERVKNLPCGETQTFTVKFDPRKSSVKTGGMSAVLPIQVSGGPAVQVRLCAVATVPAAAVSTDTLQFDAVQCGMCQIRSVQLVNQESVPCQWSIAEEVKPLKKLDKFLPLHQRQRLLQERRPPPPVFQMRPCSGLLAPGERVNVEIRFRPLEEGDYSRRLAVSVADGGRQASVWARGRGEEPRLEFGAAALQLGPCLPRSAEAEAEVTVRNPCAFPVEFYALELDSQYLKEEKILRVMKGYDENRTLLLPPRSPGEGLPAELLHYYQDYCSQLTDGAEPEETSDKEEPEGDEARGNQEPKGDAAQPEILRMSHKPAEILVSELNRDRHSSRLGELETTPVSRAIARHMGVDLSPDALAARSRRGIAVIVHGAPQADTSSAAAALAGLYGGLRLTVDAVVAQALLTGSSPVGATVRRLYERAAAEFAQRKAEEAAQAVEDDTGAKAHRETSDADEAPASVGTVDDPANDGGGEKDSAAHLADCLGGDVSVLRDLLPEQLLVDLLAERFQLSDCHRGMVLDGLQSAYTRSAAGTLQLLLKALNNRKHIYVVTLCDSYGALRARQRAQREAQEALQRQQDHQEEQWLQELDEEEYQALPEDRRRSITRRHVETLRLQKQREREQMAREEEEKKQQEEVKRLREEDLKKKSKKGGKKDAKDALKKKGLLEGKQSSEALNGRRSSCNNSKESLVDAREPPNNNKDLQKQPEEVKAFHSESPQPADRQEREKAVAEPAEVKRPPEEKELKKGKKPPEKDDKDVAGRKVPPGGKESGRPLSSLNASRESLAETKEPQDGNEGAAKHAAHHSAEADPVHKKSQPDSPQPADQPAGESAVVDELQRRFRDYEQSLVQVDHVLQHWDRVQGLLLVPLPGDEAPPGPPGPPGPPDDVSAEKQPPAGRRNKKGNSKAMSPLLSQTADRPADRSSPPDVIPHILLKATEPDSFGATALPPPDQVLDDLGLGPNGPPVPPPVTLAVVPFPEPREPAEIQQTCFTFLVPSGPEDQEEEKKDSEEDLLASSMKEEAAAATVSKSRMKGSVRESAAPKEKEKKGPKNRRLTSAKTKTKTPQGGKTPSDLADQDQDQDQHQQNLEHKRSQSLTVFRWVVPAGGETALRLWFYSETPGTSEQTFTFELLGTRRQYQLVCRGTCTYPAICTDYRTLFAHSKKVAQLKEGPERTYVIRSGYFEFGPLLCSKTRDRYKENRYPENSEKLVIHNNSGLEAEVQFSFQQDTQAATFLLDPPTMSLTPGQKQELTVWAYPTKPGQVKDSVLCLIKDNPERVHIHISCWGVQPELVLDSKQLHFDRILLHRRDARSLTMHNRTALPAAWRLQGVEELGDEFRVPQDRGHVPPNSSFSLSVSFRARKPLHIKKMLRLEVSDVEKIVGIVQTENIQVVAEAYDMSLEITPDGCLNFGTIRVFEEAKLSFKLKNQGKYEMAYKFALKATDPTLPRLDSIFSVSPQSGTLMPHEKPTAVTVVCRPDRELLISEQPILPCQVFEPKVGNEGEIIAVALKVSVQSVFSRYKITPACDINFGPLACGSKRSQSFTIENTGVFETHFTVCRVTPDAAEPGRPGGANKPPPGDSLSGRPTGAGAKVRQEAVHTPQTRLALGVFSVSPCVGTLQPGCQQLVTVDCAAEQPGSWEQRLLISVSGRDPSEHPDGAPYRLLAEVCRPGISVDMASIFEEHHQCRSSGQLSSERFGHADGVFVLDENRFVFGRVLVGRTARARLKLSNSSKVGCALTLAVRSAGPKTPRSAEAFRLSAAALSVPGQSHAFAVVSFTPQAMQPYSATFDATLEGSSGSRATPTFKGKVLELELAGEGTLPSVSVLRPALRDGEGRQLMQFRRAPVGRSRSLPLLLLNDGNVPAQVHLDLLDEHGVFALRPAPGNACSAAHTTQLDGASASERRLVHRASLRLNPEQTAEFQVGFCSDRPLSVEAGVSLQVEDNQYSGGTVRVAAEAFQDLVSLGDVGGSRRGEEQEEDEEGGNCDLLDFGDCHVSGCYQESFTITNHSSSQALRFQWPPSGPHVSFSPQVGHLHAGCSKEVTATFQSGQPATLARQSMRCKIQQVAFQQPLDQVADWDDRQRTVQWLSPLRKVVETKPEPGCSPVDGSHRELELQVSAVCDYAKFSCSADSVHFRDTMLYQSRLCQLQIVNLGSVKVEFSWQVFMDPSCSRDPGDGSAAAAASRPGSRAATSGPRPCSALTGAASLLTGNPELPPFTVEPQRGAVEPGATLSFDVRFAPAEVGRFDGRLLCSVPNLQEGDVSPSVSVSGRCLLPHCHFQLEDSDYVSGSRRPARFTAPLDPSARVVELSAVGVPAVATRSFSVLNPTSQAFSFRWRCEDGSGDLFRCLTPSGSVLPGKKAEVVFEYAAEQPDVAESRWSFVMETLSLSVPFLCVGTTREPLVYLDRPHLDLGELLVGRTVERTVDVVNAEDESFTFSVLQSSVLCEDQQSSLAVRPMNGRLDPRSRCPLSVSFTPSQEGRVSFRLVLRVRRKSEPLAMTLKADCFAVDASLRLQTSDGLLREISAHRREPLDFGQVGLSEQSAFNLLLSNLARFAIDVDVHLAAPGELLQHLEAEPQTASVQVGEQLQASLLFRPRSVCSLQDVRLDIKVKHGPTFSFTVDGGSVAPSLHFSSTKLQFGRCFLHRAGVTPPRRTLTISNTGPKDVSVQCRFGSTAVLEVDLRADVVSPGAEVEASVAFRPQEARRYQQTLTFVLNGCVTRQVEVTGQGVEMKLEVEDLRQRKLKLGSLTLGQKVKKQVVLVNRSSLELSFTLTLSANKPVDLKDLSFSPAGELRLQPGSSCVVELRFAPQRHLPAFSAELQAEFAGLLLPLLTVQGCCQGVQVVLDPLHLSFGAVVQRCQAKKKIVLSNGGDLGAGFQWETERFPAELSIAPARGYVCPGSEVPLDVTFAPVELSSDLRYEDLRCAVDGVLRPIALTVTGCCVAASAGKEVLSFVCPVRGVLTQTLSVLNPTNQACRVRPLIDGQQWSAAALLTFEPQQSRTLEVTYRPLTMTSDGKRHLGSVFLSFPDGTGLLYGLQGTAEPPGPQDTLLTELPAKTLHTQLLPVHNWLSKPQRFRVQMETVKLDKLDATVSLKGPEYIDVPALGKRDYKLSFFTYREGQYHTKVTFRNEATGEYLFYLLTFRATAASVLSTIALETAVRRVASATVEVENPLSAAVCLTSECKCPDVSVPSQHSVSGRSKCVLTLEYLPLLAGRSSARLTLSSEELGCFHYDLQLTALPAPPHDAVHFSAALGSSQTLAVKFINYSRLKQEFSCQTDCADFAVSRSVSAPPGSQVGSEAAVDVCFEPQRLGEVRGQLSLSSGIGGEYVFPLHGVCLPPRAQGPFAVRTGRSVSIPFKNVFPLTVAFSFQVDNPCFSVKAADSIASKKSLNVPVSFEAPPDGSPGPWFGRLTVSSRRCEGHRQPASWVFYLRGHRSESA